MDSLTKMGKCPVCEGKRKIRFPNGDVEQCPECLGTGKTEMATVAKSEIDFYLDSLSEQHAFLRELLASKVLNTEQRIKAFKLSAQSKPKCENCPVCEGRSIIHETDGGGTICPVCYIENSSSDDEIPF